MKIQASVLFALDSRLRLVPLVAVMCRHLEQWTRSGTLRSVPGGPCSGRGTRWTGIRRHFRARIRGVGSRWCRAWSGTAPACLFAAHERGQVLWGERIGFV